MNVALENLWYTVIMLCIMFYAMLDGFDLGVGTLHLFTRKDAERRIFLNAIGPVWDGNEVWLIVLIGGLFAGFPYAYATIFSVFYTPLIIFIFALILRAVAIEFRSKVKHDTWKNTWDILFFLGSLLISFAVGGALGNLIQGIPLDANHDYRGAPFLPFMTPYALLIGVFVLALFTMHGAIYLAMKTEGELQEKLKRWSISAIVFFIIVYVVTTMVTLIYQPHMSEILRDRPYLFVIALANILMIANIPHQVRKGNEGWAFICSCANIGLLVLLFALGSYPNIVRSTINPEVNSLNIDNSVASPKTLTVLLSIVAIGIPLVLGYGYFLYRVFRGKVKIDPHSY